MAFVTATFLALTPQLLTLVLAPFASLATTGTVEEATAWNFSFQGRLVEGDDFAYNLNKPIAGTIDHITLHGILDLGFNDIPVATFIQLANTPDQLIAQIFSGNDFLFGTFDADRLNGLAGDDSIIGGGGIDVIDGGGGTDAVAYAGTLVPVQVTLKGAAFARVTVGGAADDLIRNVEVVAGGNAGDVLRGDGLANGLRGQGGNDILRGGAGSDSLDGGAGIDTVDCSDKTAALRITLAGATTSFVKAGAVVEESLREIENALGGRGGDTIIGDALRNQLSGNGGDDILNGLGGSDVLTGGLGMDLMTGGLGRDVFDFNALAESVRGARHDTVNFRRSEGDKIDLATIDADTDGTSGNQAFRFIGAAGFSGLDGELRFAGGLLQGDTNGDRVADFEVKIVGALQAGDVIL
jgi:Ca2+-binding RTX toxin-like protein